MPIPVPPGLREGAGTFDTFVAQLSRRQVGQLALGNLTQEAGYRRLIRGSP